MGPAVPSNRRHRCRYKAHGGHVAPTSLHGLLICSIQLQAPSAAPVQDGWRVGGAALLQPPAPLGPRIVDATPMALGIQHGDLKKMVRSGRLNHESRLPSPPLVPCWGA